MRANKIRRVFDEDTRTVRKSIIVHLCQLFVFVEAKFKPFRSIATCQKLKEHDTEEYFA